MMVEQVNEFQCCICERDIHSFKDEIEKWEYEVIGLCQECLDCIFTVVYSPSEKI